MLSSDHGWGRPLNLRTLAVAGIALLLGACSVQPLYGPTPVGSHTVNALDGIRIDQVSTRVAQQVRNNLIFNLNDRSADGPVRYRMKLLVSTTTTPLGVTPVQSAPSSNVNVTATYVVTAVDDDKVLLRDTTRASASYDRVNQAFANERAKRNAEDRAAEALATDIRIRLSAAASQGII